jgi:hypothetical protein
MGERRGVYRILVARSEGRRSLGRSRRNCKNNKNVSSRNGLGHGLN